MFKKILLSDLIIQMQKLHNLLICHVLVIFGNGTIVGNGSFEELIESNGKFKRMWKSFREER